MKFKEFLKEEKIKMSSYNLGSGHLRPYRIQFPEGVNVRKLWLEYVYDNPEFRYMDAEIYDNEIGFDSQGHRTRTLNYLKKVLK